MGAAVVARSIDVGVLRLSHRRAAGLYDAPTGGPWRQITNGPGTSLAPSWSWDGSKIASYGGGRGILISPADGGPAHVMSNARASAPSFSPIDNRLLYGADSGAGPAGLPSLENIWVVPASEATPPVKVLSEGGAFAQWMPDGKSILTIVMRDAASVAVSIADDGTHERRLTNLSGRRGALWGSIAADGRFLYFIWSEDVGDLWVMDLVQAQK